MARRILNRKELRAEQDELERREAGSQLEGPAAGAAAEAPAKTTAAKKPVRRKSSKAAKEVRLKAFWAVFNQAMSPVAQFEYSQRAEADQKAKELTETKKAPHFVQLVKKVIEE